MGKSGGKFFIGALIGAAAGAVAGLLFAPRSGKQTRKIIGDKTKDYAEKGREAVVAEEEKARKAIGNIADKISK